MKMLKVSENCYNCYNHQKTSQSYGIIYNRYRGSITKKINKINKLNSGYSSYISIYINRYINNRESRESIYIYKEFSYNRITSYNCDNQGIFIHG
jgi:hypothetical protein